MLIMLVHLQHHHDQSRETCRNISSFTGRDQQHCCVHRKSEPVGVVQNPPALLFDVVSRIPTRQ